MSLASDRTPAMDGIRGLAVLTVYLSHTSGRGQALSPLLQFHGIGHVGVYLFFVLSGFLLADNLIHEWRTSGRISVRDFLIRRILRIAPLYFLVVTSVFVWQQWTGTHAPKALYIDGGWSRYLQHLVFVAGDGVFWTIPAEFMFYLVLPFIVLFMLRQGRNGAVTVVLTAIVYFGWAASVQLWQVLPGGAAPKLVDIRQSSQYLDVFLCGVLAAYVLRSSLADRLGPAETHAIDLAGLTAIVLTFLVTFACVSHQFLFFHRPYYSLRWYSLAYGLLFGFIIVAACRGKMTRKVFELPPLRLLGIVGFSWYLIHLAVFAVVNQTAFPPPVKFLISTAVCSVGSMVLYLSVERPFIRLGKALTSK